MTLRYFVPRHEMRMCVHATIAAVTALISSGVLAAGRTTISTASGEHHVTWDRDGGPPEVTVAQLEPRFGPPAPVHAELAAALGLPSGSICPDRRGSRRAGRLPGQPAPVGRTGTDTHHHRPR
jgi:PhzF family phenazine biosynthesis protein